jgi:translation initiation factor 2 alpha subunit (eIF-2alpha)
MEKMGREELIEAIKRLTYKNVELETVKMEAMNESKKMKMQDLEKYRKVLSDVKSFK